MKDTPKTAKALNRWLHAHFQVFEGPPRSFFELPVSISIGDEHSHTEANHIIRVAYLSLGLKGEEEDSCKQIAEALTSAVSHNSYIDATEALFIRREFVFAAEPEGRFVTGRLAFWSPAANKKLCQALCYHPEGMLMREARREPA